VTLFRVLIGVDSVVEVDGSGAAMIALWRGRGGPSGRISNVSSSSTSPVKHNSSEG
jgi:hypothetical protein